MRSPRFEAFFANHCNLDLDEVTRMFDGETYRSRNWHVEIAWAAWCAALGFEPVEPTL